MASDSTRREFIGNAGRMAAGFTLTAILPGCETITIEEATSDVPYRFLTREDQFFWYSFGGFEPEQSPVIDPDQWKLDVRSGGNSVDEVAYRKLRALESEGHAISYMKTLRCIRGSFANTIEGVRAANAIFTGIPLRKVLEDTAISGEAAKLRFVASDLFQTSLLYSRILDEEQLPVILAFEMNGRPISPERGGPVRLIVPEMWAFKSMKWISAVDATTDPSTYGSMETADIAGKPELDSPGLMSVMALSYSPGATLAEVQGPSLLMHGMALVGGARIAAVEIIIDNGPVQIAQIPTIDEVLESLGHEALLVKSTAQFGKDWPYANVWAPWSFAVELPPGPHNIKLRAVDSNGVANPNVSADPLLLAQELSIDLTVT